MCGRVTRTLVFEWGSVMGTGRIVMGRKHCKTRCEMGKSQWQGTVTCGTPTQLICHRVCITRDRTKMSQYITCSHTVQFQFISMKPHGSFHSSQAWHAQVLQKQSRNFRPHREQRSPIISTGFRICYPTIKKWRRRQPFVLNASLKSSLSEQSPMRAWSSVAFSKQKIGFSLHFLFMWADCCARCGSY